MHRVLDDENSLALVQGKERVSVTTLTVLGRRPVYVPLGVVHCTEAFSDTRI